MKNYLLTFLLLSVLALIESVFTSYFLVLVVTLILFFRGEEEQAYYIGFFGGLLLDFFGTRVVGLSSLYILLVLLTVYLLKKVIPINGISTLILFVLAIFIFCYLTLSGFSFVSYSGFDLRFFFWIVVKNLVGVAVVYPFSSIVYELYKKNKFRRA